MNSAHRTSSSERIPVHRQLLEAGCTLAERGELSSAVALFLRAARLGNPEAQVNLGNALDAGHGVAMSFTEARRWYKNAARRGAPEGAFNLAISYRAQGNDRMARFWLERANEMGDTDAREFLRTAKPQAVLQGRRSEGDA